MKKLAIITFSLLSLLSIQAQEEDKEIQTLFKKDNSVGFYGGVFTKPTLLHDQEALFVGSELNLVFGHHLNVGIIGAGTVTSVYSGTYTPSGSSLFHEVGYGGIKLEPVLFSKSVAHVTFPLILGGGGSTLHSGEFNYYGDWNYNYEFYDTDFFFLAEPGINLEINLYKHLRLDIGGSYRFTSNVNILGSPIYNIEGFAGNIGLKFGWF